MTVILDAIIDALTIISYGLAVIILVPIIAILIIYLLDVIGSVSIFMLAFAMDALDNIRHKLAKISRKRGLHG